MTPVIFFVCSFKNRKQIQDAEEVSAEWGTLFYEFNNEKGLGNSQFYFYFFLRRILYIVIMIFLRDWPIIQLSLNCTLSITVFNMQKFFYLAIFRPFNERILNFSNTLSEFCITLIFIFLAISNLDIPDSLYSSIDYVLVNLVDSIMGVQMIASVSVFIKTVIIMIKLRLRAKVSNVATATEIEESKKKEFIKL